MEREKTERARAICPLAAALALKRGNYSLRAMLASHSWFIGQDSLDAVAELSGVAAMFTSCAGDGNKAAVGKKAFEACTGRPKVFANLANGSHMEPIHGGRSNGFDARFLACHVAAHAPSCAAVDNGSLCAAEDWVGDDCFEFFNPATTAQLLVSRRRTDSAADSVGCC